MSRILLACTWMWACTADGASPVSSAAADPAAPSAPDCVQTAVETVPGDPTPVTFEIVNALDEIVVLSGQPGAEASPTFRMWRGEAQLSVPENFWCPCRCPAEGMPECLDCGRAPQIAIEVPPAASLSLSWDGRDHPPTQRSCGGAAATCVTSRTTAPGPLRIEVCGTIGAVATFTSADRRACATARFDHPAKGPAKLELQPRTP